MRVFIAASEAVPFIKTGGLADVAGSLVKEYRKMGIEAFLILPLYSRIKDSFDLIDTGVRLNIPVGRGCYEGRLWSQESYAYFIECPEFFDRPELYGTSCGDYPDNASRFIFFCRAVLETCLVVGLKPDIIHCNDWQTGLIPLYLRTIYKCDFFTRTATVMTIHNLGYQGLSEPEAFNLTNLSEEWFNPEGLEFYGKINLLKAGLIASDIITTVSRTYAAEILSPENGHGLEGMLNKRFADIYGVINGIDIDEWNPWTDKEIFTRYKPADISGKALCKKELIKECLFEPEAEGSPLLAFIGRLSAQKGIELLLDSVDYVLSGGARIIMLGRGDAQFQMAIDALAEKHKRNVFVSISYDEQFAHRVYAGSDIFLMPSRYEPCGLGQLIAMRYGTIPVARKTGGLADTITDYMPLKGCGTGFLFEEYSASALRECLRSAFCAYIDKKKWKQLVLNAMNTDFSWKNSAKEYIALYDVAIHKHLL